MDSISGFLSSVIDVVCFIFLLQTLEIWAVLDAEPEANETFTVSLSSPTGGARLGSNLHMFITVLQNLAPSGLFRIGPTLNRSDPGGVQSRYSAHTAHVHKHPRHISCVFRRRTDTTVVVEEGGRAVFLTVSRSNGLETAVSVEWETVSEKATGMGKTGDRRLLFALRLNFGI